MKSLTNDSLFHIIIISAHYAYLLFSHFNKVSKGRVEYKKTKTKTHVLSNILNQKSLSIYWASFECWLYKMLEALLVCK